MTVTARTPSLQNFQHFALNLARLSVVGMAVSMPTSRAIFNICALIMLLAWIAAGRWTERMELFKRSPVAWSSLMLFGVCALSLVFTPNHDAENWGQLLVYSKLLYVPIIMSLMNEPTWLNRAWLALLTGLLLTLGVFVLDIWMEIPGTVTYGQHLAGHGVFYHHIAQGMGLTFIGAYGLHRAFLEPSSRKRILWAAVALLTAALLIFLGRGRTGQLSVLAAYGLVALIHLPRRWKVSGFVAAGLCFGVLIVLSGHMQERFALAIQEAKTFQQDGDSTSIGARLKAWELSLNLIEQRPITGHGVGSYRPLAYKHFSGSNICGLGVCEQPHNQFLMTAVEAGLPGVLALLFFLTAPFLRRQSSWSEHDALVPAFIAIVVITALFDSALSIRAEGYFTVTVLGLLMASRYRSDQPPQMR